MLLASYRQLMRAIRRLPEGRRLEATLMARSEYRYGTLPLEAALSKSRQSLEYVKLLTPPTTGKSSGNAGRYVMRDGELVRVEATAAPGGGIHVGKDSRVTDEQYRRHHELVRRQHFMGKDRFK